MRQEKELKKNKNISKTFFRKTFSTSSTIKIQHNRPLSSKFDPFNLLFFQQTFACPHKHDFRFILKVFDEFEQYWCKKLKNIRPYRFTKWPYFVKKSKNLCLTHLKFLNEKIILTKINNFISLPDKIYLAPSHLIYLIHWNLMSSSYQFLIKS